MADETDIAEQFERHLTTTPKQTWLLGAGVSSPAKIPLMFPLTTHVYEIASKDHEITSKDLLKGEASQYILDFIKEDCGKNSHIEHHLTQLGNLISIAEGSDTSEATVGDRRIDKKKLRDVHKGLIIEIASIVRWGFQAAGKDTPSQIGTQYKPIVEIHGHQNFIEAVFNTNRAGRDFNRPPVEIFTTNYDTLIEDALALVGVEFEDGFTGGGVGFWNPRNYDNSSGARAIVSKLHGSIDWYRPESENSNLLRVRHGDTYPGVDGSVMIYPQATKYVDTQRDPFAEIFQRFRRCLSQGRDQVLLICGYSFGDNHINAEIETAMSSAKNQLTIIAFADEPDNELPKTLNTWLSGPWKERLFVASPKGIYYDSTDPVFPSSDGGKRDWWTFDGVTSLLNNGLPNDIQEEMK